MYSPVSVVELSAQQLVKAFFPALQLLSILLLRLCPHLLPLWRSDSNSVPLTSKSEHRRCLHFSLVFEFVFPYHQHLLEVCLISKWARLVILPTAILGTTIKIVQLCNGLHSKLELEYGFASNLRFVVDSMDLTWKLVRNAATQALPAFLNLNLHFNMNSQWSYSY